MVLLAASLSRMAINLELADFCSIGDGFYVWLVVYRKEKREYTVFKELTYVTCEKDVSTFWLGSV